MKRLHVFALVAVAGAGLATYTVGTAFANEHNVTDCHAHMQHSAAQINQLHNELNLTAGQEPAWQAMVSSMKSAHAENAGMASSSQMTVPAHIDAMLAMLHEHETQMTTVAKAVKAFYATLTPDQRRTFDRAFQSHGLVH